MALNVFQFVLGPFRKLHKMDRNAFLAMRGGRNGGYKNRGRGVQWRQEVTNRDNVTTVDGESWGSNERRGGGNKWRMQQQEGRVGAAARGEATKGPCEVTTRVRQRKAIARKEE